jgi:hypothetical protein
MKSDGFYLRWHEAFWDGAGDATVECRSVKLVITRKPHLCAGCNHFKGKEHPAGTRMVMDRAKVDGDFGTAYTCLPCIEAWAKECDPHELETMGRDSSV